MSARQEDECQELSKVTKYMSERQGKLLALMDRKRNLMSDAPEELRKTDIPRNQKLGREDLWRGDGAVGEKRILEEWLERREDC